MIEFVALAVLLLFIMMADWVSQKDWEMVKVLVALVGGTGGILWICSWRW